MNRIAAAILAAVVTGCAAPQYNRPLAEGRIPGYEHIEAAKTDAYTVFMRTWKRVHEWLILRW